MGARDYTIPVIKRLWALSGNECYMPECRIPLAFVESAHVMGEIAHIRAASAGGCRYDPAMTDDERRDFPNLLLMCPTHHTLVDHVSCENWSIEQLEKIKAAHEAANHPVSLPESFLGVAARASIDLLAVYEERVQAATVEHDEITFEGGFSEYTLLEPDDPSTERRREDGTTDPSRIEGRSPWVEDLGLGD